MTLIPGRRSLSAFGTASRTGSVRDSRSTSGPAQRYDAANVFPGWAAVFAIYFPSDVIAGRRIHFVEDDPVAAEIALEGRRTATLIVSSKDAPSEVYGSDEHPLSFLSRPLHVRCR